MNLTQVNLDAAGVQRYIREAFPDRQNAVVTDFVEISSGWESDVYALDLVSGRAAARSRESWVLRVYPGNDAVEKSRREFRALQQLHAAGYPVPAVLHLVQDASPFGKPFVIMERVPGRVMWWETFNGPEDEQCAHFERFIRLFVELHALDWRLFIDGDASAPAPAPYVYIDEFITMFRGYCQRFNQPGYLPVLDWAAARRDAVPCERPAPIHWDYHPANLLVDESGAAKVIDWTQFQISDPRLDLAWTMILVSSSEREGTRERILRTYESMSGHPVRGIEVFEVLACAKRLGSVTISLAAGPEQLGMRPGAEETMRQHLPSLGRVYERLQALTGLQIPEFEAL